MGLGRRVLKMFMPDYGEGWDVLVGSAIFSLKSFLSIYHDWNYCNSPLYHNGCIQVVFFVLIIECIKYCDIIVEYSRIVLLNLRADWGWRRGRFN